MAERLIRSGFADGAMFHAYHAYECAISALIAASGVAVPPSHAGRFVLYEQLRDAAKPYATTANELEALTVQTRNDALYYDEANDILPADRFTVADAARLLPIVHRFAQEVWREIG